MLISLNRAITGRDGGQWGICPGCKRDGGHQKYPQNKEILHVKDG